MTRSRIQTNGIADNAVTSAKIAASPAFTGNASFVGTTAPVVSLQINSAVDSGVLALRGRTNDGAALLYFQNNAGSLNNCYIVGFNNQMELYGANYVGPLVIGATGLLTSQPTYDNTAAGSAVVVTSSGQIRRTSSSLKYKQDIENLDYTIVVNAVDNLRPVWYRTKTPSGDDKTTWSHVGLIAEEVAEVEPRLVRYRTVEVTEADGVRTETALETPEPEDVDYGRLAVLLLAEVKALRARVAALEQA